MKHPTGVHFFVFIGGRRQWNPLEGHTPPTDGVCEVRSIPGNLVGLGDTMEEAAENLQRLLDIAFDRSGGSVSAWYQEQSKRLSPQEKAELGRLFIEANAR